jgi:hypothetical protein
MRKSIDAEHRAHGTAFAAADSAFDAEMSTSTG